MNVFGVMDVAAMSSVAAAQLYRNAAVLSSRSEQCVIVAQNLNALSLVIMDRYKPVAMLHTEKVWRGQAASVSRERLHTLINVSLQHIRNDIRHIVQDLIAKSKLLNRQAAELRYRAHLMEMAANASGAIS